LNYIKQLNEFYSTLDYKPLSANSIAIYFVLLQVANKTGWIDKFKVANTVLMSKCDLNMQKLIRARNSLINQGYIKYSKGKNQNDAPIYSIIQLYDIASNITNNITDNIENNIANDMTDNTINKQNETKQKEKNIKKKYGENKNVKFTDEEFEEVKIYFPNDYMKRIQSLDDYIQSTGKKYKDYFATLKNWARKDGYKPPIPKNEVKEEKFIEIDTSQLTQEEYGKLVREEITIKELIEKGRIHV